MMRLRPRETRGGLGCGTVGILLLIALTVPAFWFGQTVWKAKQVEQAVNDALGEAPAFVPAPDGVVQAKRIEAFLRVRERVFESCSEFQTHLAEVIRLEELENDPDISKKEVLRQGFGGLKQVFRSGPVFLRFMEARNRALLEEKMGLGEYMYIYVLAYREQLQREEFSRFAQFEEAYVGGRARRELAQILRNQQGALETGEMSPHQAKLAAGLERQLAEMAKDEKPLPWEKELPQGIAEAFEPYATSLEALYCSGLAKVELSQKNKGLDFQN